MFSFSDLICWVRRLNSERARLTFGIATDGIQHGLIGRLYDTSVGYRERVLGRQSPMCPERKIIAVFEVKDFCNQLLAQDRGRLCGEHRLGLPRLVDRTIRWLSAVLPLPARLDLDRRRGFDQEVGASRSSSPAIPTNANSA